MFKEDGMRVQSPEILKHHFCGRKSETPGGMPWTGFSVSNQKNGTAPRKNCGKKKTPETGWSHKHVFFLEIPNSSTKQRTYKKHLPNSSWPPQTLRHMKKLQPTFGYPPKKKEGKNQPPRRPTRRWCFFWANYSDCSPPVGHPNGGDCKGIPLQIPEKFRFRNYSNLPSFFVWPKLLLVVSCFDFSMFWPKVPRFHSTQWV